MQKLQPVLVDQITGSLNLLKSVEIAKYNNILSLFPAAETVTAETVTAEAVTAETVTKKGRRRRKKLEMIFFTISFLCRSYRFRGVEAHRPTPSGCMEEL